MVVDGVALVGYVALLLAPVAGLGVLRDTLLGRVAMVLAGVLCLARAHSLRDTPSRANLPAAGLNVEQAARADRRRIMRRAFALLGAGCLAFAAGDLYYLLIVARQDPVSEPSLADIGYLACYPLFTAAILVAARAELGSRIGRALALDGLTGALGTAALGSALGLPVILAASSGSDAALVVNAA